MKYRNYVLTLMALPMLGGCGSLFGLELATAGVFAASHGVFSRPDVNLQEKNYAAADFLVGQIAPYIGDGDIILAQALEEQDHRGISSPLGSAIPEGIGLRFAELGYNVWLHEVAANANEGLYPAPPKSAKPDIILKGTYKTNRDDLAVSLRMVDISSGQVVASFDYKLLLSKEVRDMSKTPTRIFRVAD